MISARAAAIGLLGAWCVCAHASAATPKRGHPPDSGIEGRALIGPKRPSAGKDDAQDDTIPYSTTLLVLAASDGHQVARVETGEDGRFKVPLPPGEYIVRPPDPAGKRLPRAPEQRVRVRSKQFAQVTIRFDSGLR